jgi:Lysine methyltransferase
MSEQHSDSHRALALQTYIHTYIQPEENETVPANPAQSSSINLPLPGSPHHCTTAAGDDEAMLDSISQALAACSGPLASGGRASTFCYGNGLHAHISEGTLGDGLGAQLWSVSHILCRELAAHPALVRGRRVLELGSGTGLVGIVAAALGAQLVRVCQMCVCVCLCVCKPKTKHLYGAFSWVFCSFPASCLHT